jgi:hypothetical protein
MTSFTTSQGPGQISSKVSLGLDGVVPVGGKTSPVTCHLAQSKSVRIQTILLACACTHMIAVGLWLAILQDGTVRTVGESEDLELSDLGRVAS